MVADGNTALLFDLVTQIDHGRGRVPPLGAAGGGVHVPYRPPDAQVGHAPLPQPQPQPPPLILQHTSGQQQQQRVRQATRTARSVATRTSRLRVMSSVLEGSGCSLARVADMHTLSVMLIVQPRSRWSVWTSRSTISILLGPQRMYSCSRPS